MFDPVAEAAIEAARSCGRAILKVISANDTGTTGGHQCGFYLPKHAWRMFTPHRPEKGQNRKSSVDIHWHDGSRTDSAITWYGVRTRAEYRLTRFGRGFRFLGEEQVGSLLVLVPRGVSRFSAFIVNSDDGIEAVQADLGVRLIDRVGVFDRDAPATATSRNECLERRFASFLAPLDEFPDGETFSAAARDALGECEPGLSRRSRDDQLIAWRDTEFELFQRVERKLIEPTVRRGFGDLEKFLALATGVSNRRRARAGRSFENHFAELLRLAGLAPATRPADVEGRPDVLLPGSVEYHDPAFPAERLTTIGLKTSCKDRWRQVLREAPRARNRFLLTMQEEMSEKQCDEIRRASITLVVPRPLHDGYPKARRPTLWDVDRLVEWAVANGR
jgi:type II restriction enzyme